jgi:hypothetical protein
VRQSGVSAGLISILFAGFAAACGGGQATVAPSNATPQQRGTAYPETIASEGCSESGRRVELLDVNGDQKADIHKVFDKGSGKELCRVTDLNHDGKPDLIEYFDDGGNVRRREYCYDNDGLVNAIEYYDAGKLVRREYDTTHRHKIDTWDWFDASGDLDAKTGRPKHPKHRERDTTGNGKINEWWDWAGDKVTIAVDTNGDGKPDPTSAVTLNADGTPANTGGGGGSAPAATPSAAPSAAPSPAPSAPPSALPVTDAGATSTAATGSGGAR